MRRINSLISEVEFELIQFGFISAMNQTSSNQMKLIRNHELIQAAMFSSRIY